MDVSTLTLFPNSSVDSVLAQYQYEVFGIVMFLSLFGALFGAFSSVTILITKELRKGSEVLIVHDLLIGTFLCSVTFPSIAYTFFAASSLRQPPPVFICTFHFVVLSLGMSAGNWNCCFLAVNRVVAILFPHKYKDFTEKRVTILIIVVCWLTSVSSRSSFIFGLDVHYVIMPVYNVCSLSFDCTVRFWSLWGICSRSLQRLFFTL